MSQEIIKSYKTKGIKELQTYIKQGTSHYALQWSDGGQLLNKNESLRKFKWLKRVKKLLGLLLRV